MNFTDDAGDCGLTCTSCGKRPFESVLSGRPRKTRYVAFFRILTLCYSHLRRHTSVPLNSEISEGTTIGTSTNATDISSDEVGSPHEIFSIPRTSIAFLVE